MRNDIDRRALHGLSYGLYIVSAGKGSRRSGCIVNTAIQVASSPPRVAVAVNKENLTHDCIQECSAFAVSILEQDTPLSFIGLFGFRSGRDVDKLVQARHEAGVTGCPVVTEHTLSFIEARVFGRADAGTHTVFLGDVVRSTVLEEGTPMTYAYYRRELKGSSPKNAPTYMPEGEAGEERTERSSRMTKYVCNVCGYVYDPARGDPDNGVEPGTAFEDLPQGWRCPLCGAGKEQFSPQD